MDAERVKKELQWWYDKTVKHNITGILFKASIAAIEQLQAENAQLHAIMALLDSCNSDEGIVLAMQCDYAAMKGGN